MSKEQFVKWTTFVTTEWEFGSEGNARASVNDDNSDPGKEILLAFPKTNHIEKSCLSIRVESAESLANTLLAAVKHANSIRKPKPTL